MMVGNGGHAKVLRDFVDDWNGAIVAVGDNRSRKCEVERLKKEEWRFAPAQIHPRAYVARDVVIGEGTVVMAGAVIQPGARIGRHCIVNTCASVDHDCLVKDYAHIAPGAHLCGNVHVGEGALIGVGVGVAPGARIPAWSLVKARRLEIEPL